MGRLQAIFLVSGCPWILYRVLTLCTRHLSHLWKCHKPLLQKKIQIRLNLMFFGRTITIMAILAVFNYLLNLASGSFTFNVFFHRQDHSICSIWSQTLIKLFFLSLVVKLGCFFLRILSILHSPWFLKRYDLEIWEVP